MASQNSPPYLIDHTCKAIRGVRSGAPGFPTFEMFAGDVGQVLRIHQPGLLGVHNRRTNTRGLVPASHLEIGVKVTGQVKYITAEPGENEPNGWILGQEVVSAPAEMGGDILVANFRRSQPGLYEGDHGAHTRTFFSEVETEWAREAFGLNEQRECKVELATATPGLPPLGTSWQIVFEVRMDGKPHPFSLTYLPGIGPFRDWKDAQTLALKLEWKVTAADGSEETHYYFIREKDSVLADGARPGSFSSYGKAMSILWFLRRQEPLPGDTLNAVRPYHLMLGRAVVRELKSDYFSQTMTLSSALSAGPPIRSANTSRKSRQQITQEMEGVGLENVDGSWNTFTGHADEAGLPATAGRPSRNKCDTCFLRDFTMGTCPCIRDDHDEHDDCMYCAKIVGRPCSWTLTEGLLQPGKAIPLQTDPRAVRMAAWKPEILFALVGVDDATLRQTPTFGVHSHATDIVVSTSGGQV